MNKQCDLFTLGIYVACYIVEAVLKSNLRCFFDMTCLQALKNGFDLHVNVSNVVLDRMSTRYQPLSSLLEIASNLMVENWINETSYEKFFTECHPTSCTLKFVSRSNPVYIITTTIGLIGGLTQVLRFIIPRMVIIVVRYCIPVVTERFVNRNRVMVLSHNA